MTDFHEDDEPIENVVAAFERGEKGVTVVGPIEPRKLDTVMSVRLSPEDIDYLRWYANATGMTVSEVLRQQIRALPSCVFQVAG